MVTRQTRVINKTGLHARPASLFVMEAKKYAAEVTIRNLTGEKPAVNAKSIIRLLAEGIVQGTLVEISANGADEEQAIHSLVALIESGCGEN